MKYLTTLALIGLLATAGLSFAKEKPSCFDPSKETPMDRYLKEEHQDHVEKEEIYTKDHPPTYEDQQRLQDQLEGPQIDRQDLNTFEESEPGGSKDSE